MSIGNKKIISIKSQDDGYNYYNNYISEIQYKLMKATIGINGYKAYNSNENLFTMWKNIYQQELKFVDGDWLHLIELGLAESSLSANKRLINYSLTKKGVDFVMVKEDFMINYNNYFSDDEIV